MPLSILQPAGVVATIFLGIAAAYQSALENSVGVTALLFACAAALYALLFALPAALNRKINLTQARVAIISETHPLTTHGQSKALDLSWEASPVNISPHDYSSKKRDEAFIRCITTELRIDEAEAREKYTAWKRDFPWDKFTNDPNLIVDGPIKSLAHVHNAKICDFATILKLQTIRGHRLHGYTANALPALNGGTRLLIQKRGKIQSLDGADGEYHIFGGSMDPYKDIGSFERCAERELFEESSIRCDVSDCPILLHEEAQYAKSMVTFLGVPADRARRFSISEGAVEAVELSDLPNVLAEHWVDSGRHAILIWLSLGCPVGGRRVVPGAYAKKILEDSTKRISPRT